MTVVNPTRGVELTGSTGSIAVYFDRGNPAVAATFSGTTAVFFDPAGPTIKGITDSIAVYFDRANPSVAATFSGSIATYFDPSAPTVKAQYGSGTFLVAFDRANPSVSIGGASSSIGVYFDRSNPQIGGITNSVAVYFDRANPSVAATFSGSIAVYFDQSNPAVNPSVAYNSGVVGGTTQRTVHATNVGASVRLMANSGVDVGDVDILSIAAGDNNIGNVDIVSGTLTGITNSIAVYFQGSNPKVNLGTDILNISSTAIIPQTASGSTSTAGNNTVVSPEASRNIKVYAFSLTTTAQVGIAPRWTTGASAGATERWRVALQAPSQGIAGANLAVTPPAYLFAMGANTTLALYLDAGSLVHYSVAYFKESA